MSNHFDTLTVADVSCGAATTPEQLRMVDSVISLPFQGDVVARAQGAKITPNHHAWLLRTIDVILTSPTRRPFAVRADISLQATQGQALARITVDGQTTSRQIRADNEPRAFDASLRLAIRRSTYPRDRLRLMVWVEASSATAGGEAQAEVDSIDVRAR